MSWPIFKPTGLEGIVPDSWLQRVRWLRESDHVIAILHPEPAAIGHCFLFPKKHSPSTNRRNLCSEGHDTRGGFFFFFGPRWLLPRWQPRARRKFFWSFSPVKASEQNLFEKVMLTTVSRHNTARIGHVSTYVDVSARTHNRFLSRGRR